LESVKLKEFGEKIKNGKLSNYFNISEFTSKDFPKNPTALEKYMLEQMIRRLNVVRGLISSPIIITDCYRDLDKYNRLIEDGYNPSPTSDHFWGQPIPTLRDKDQEKYGEHYTFSSGAVDFVAPKYDMEKVFQSIIKLYNNNFINVGQCILEKNPKTGSEWIHFSNPKSTIYSNGLIEAIGISKYKFLRSDNNGKSYKAVKV
jgi:hypothetical protein